MFCAESRSLFMQVHIAAFPLPTTMKIVAYHSRHVHRTLQAVMQKPDLQNSSIDKLW